ncbi:MAG: DUF4388 domain-containing protein, partial [Candidatus Aminicenantes bacterium]|nr:DUF4388 domain-containing protein [Candidatus Aminicenantes bacterium]
MTGGFPGEGALKAGDIYSLLYYMYKNAVPGLLVVRSGDNEKRLVIADKKIVFASSNSIDDSLGNYLLKEKVITKEIYDRTCAYMTSNKMRFGRAAIELGSMNYDSLWQWVRKHLEYIVFSVFEISAGEYRIVTDCREQEKENIILDLEIVAVIVEGMRRFRSGEFLYRRFENVEDLYIDNARMIHQLDLKPYEIHIYDLVKRESSVKKIISASELLEFDTLRILYLFLILEVVSTAAPKKMSAADETEKEGANLGFSTFKSFEEALKFYNTKYESIFKVLSKEIGPIALSILSRAVEDIMDNLPHYFQRIKLISNG